MIVELNNHEMYHFGLVGFRRNLESIAKKRTARFPEKVAGELFGYHIISAMAEGAVAKATGRYHGFHEGKFSSGDVGEMEVRWSLRNDLKVRDRDSGIVVSVTGEPPNFKIVGYIDADEAKRDEWKKDFGRGKPAYFVPHKNLNKFDLDKGKNDVRKDI